MIGWGAKGGRGRLNLHASYMNCIYFPAASHELIHRGVSKQAAMRYKHLQDDTKNIWTVMAKSVPTQQEVLATLEWSLLARYSQVLHLSTPPSRVISRCIWLHNLQ